MQIPWYLLFHPNFAPRRWMAVSVADCDVKIIHNEWEISHPINAEKTEPNKYL